MSYRILVVDDDKSIIKMIKDFLEMEEYSVDTALDGEAALQKAETQPDLISKRGVKSTAFRRYGFSHLS